MISRHIYITFPLEHVYAGPENEYIMTLLDLFIRSIDVFMNLEASVSFLIFSHFSFLLKFGDEMDWCVSIIFVI